MRQAAGLLVAAAVAAFGALVLGEYDLQGATALVGFPVYAVAVAEVALVVARRLQRWASAVLVLLVCSGLAWALWISFGRFRAGNRPPATSWALVLVAAACAAAWARPGRGRRPRPDPEEGPA